MTDSRRVNRLATATSPYLLQHARNPVDWYPWGAEALQRAKDEDRPLLLSIGYAACHWCHVMERESFEDEAIAAAMNESFVCIKVDREERPDLDEVYMAATIATNGSGGWPMTVFATPDGRPFFAGTYFPPRATQGRPGFPDVLERIASLWRSDRERLLNQSSELTQHLQESAAPARAVAIPAAASEACVKLLGQTFEERWGGFGPAPKFPPAQILRVLLRVHARTGDARALAMAARTLDRMREGGMYDHLAGGFARYSTDERWHVPHFEKMLYDSALLVRAYLDAWQIGRDPDHRRVAVETLDWMRREMQLEHGGFASATDADSEGIEGKYFVFSKEEIERVLGDAAASARFCAAYDVTPSGNWEGHNVLWTPRPLDEIATEARVDRAELERDLAASREKLLAFRSERIPPLRDDKALAAWNGLAIAAMADAGRILCEPRFVESAQRAAAFVREKLGRPDGGLFRSHRAGTSHLGGYLEDYAFVADGLLDLYEATGDEAHLAEGERLVLRMIADFHDDQAGGFFQTAHAHETLIVRTRDGADGATPSANAVAARVLVRLASHTGDVSLRDRAAHAVAAHGALVRRAPRAFATSLLATEDIVEPAIEIAIVGIPDAPDALALERVIAETYLPNRAIARHDPRGAGSSRPLLSGKGMIDGKAAVYVCRGFACAAPATDPVDLARTLTEATEVAHASRATAARPPLWNGAATADGTTRSSSGLPASAVTRVGELQVSRLVIAPRPSTVDMESVLGAALGAGCNAVLVLPEVALRVGAALGALRDRGLLGAREELVLIAPRAPEETPELLAARTTDPLGVESIDLFLQPEPDDDAHVIVMSLFRASDATPSPPLAAGSTALVLGALEAQWRGRLVRLDAEAPPEGPAFEDARAALDALEEEYRRTIAPSLASPGGRDADPRTLLTFAKATATLPAELGSLDEVEIFVRGVLEPALSAALGSLDTLPGLLGQRWKRLRALYVPALQALLSALRSRVGARARSDAEAVLREIEPHLPHALRTLSPVARGLALALSSSDKHLIAVDVANVDDAEAVGIALRVEPFDVHPARRALAP